MKKETNKIAFGNHIFLILLEPSANIMGACVFLLGPGLGYKTKSQNCVVSKYEFVCVSSCAFLHFPAFRFVPTDVFLRFQMFIGALLSDIAFLSCGVLALFKLCRFAFSRFFRWCA